MRAHKSYIIPCLTLTLACSEGSPASGGTPPFGSHDSTPVSATHVDADGSTGTTNDSAGPSGTTSASGPTGGEPTTAGTTGATTSDATGTTGTTGTADAGEDTDTTTGVEFPSDAVFVHAVLGDDDAPGTMDAPMKTIQSGILRALYIGGHTVHVSEGVYAVDSSKGEHVTMKEGVSLLGGYKADDWFVRDVVQYPSRIIDTNEVLGTPEQPNWTVDGGQNVTPDTVLDGFVIEGAQVDYSYAVYIRGSNLSVTDNVLLTNTSGGSGSVTLVVTEAGPRIVRNTIHGPKLGALQHSHAISCYQQCKARIDGNRILTGGGQSSTGLYILTSEPAVVNNVFIGSPAVDVTILIRTHDSSALIVSNTMVAPEANWSYGIYVDGASASHTIDNNILAQIKTCIYEENNPDLTTKSARNNLLACSHALLRRGILPLATTIVQFENMYKNIGALSSGNLSTEIKFVDEAVADYRLATNPCVITEGGLDHSQMFTSDAEDQPRTVPWSIGAYESDAMCW